jgi:L-ascorbate metabolism protein UlaG (beta-lactamase superfamily)
MITKWVVSICCVFVIGLCCSAAWAQDVTITPLGSQQGEFCVGDRALLFVDPTGVRILTAPGRTVNGSFDPRLPKPSDPSGGVHVLLIDHPHVDHIGDVFFANCAGTSTTAFKFPASGNAPEIASVQNSAVLVGGEQGSFFTQKIKDVSGTAPGSCPTVATGADNVLTVPRTSPCVGTIRGGTITVALQGQTQGVKITTIPAYHSAGAAPAEVDSLDGIPGPGVAPGLTGYAGSESGYIIRFTNGLTVLWTGDSGLISDWATDSEFYKPNLAVVHMDGLFTMGPDEAAFAVERLIHPTTVIPEHINQVSTSGGVVVPGLRLDAFIDRLHEGRIVVPLSGLPITCDGKGNCSGPGLVERERDRDRSH